MHRRVLACLLVSVALLCAQRRVDPRNTYHRIICVLPMVGAGTAEDPRRPQYAPWHPAGTLKPGTQPAANEIIGFTQVPTDDGKAVIAEFVARDRSAFKAILADSSLKIFEKGVQTQDEIESALRLFKKDFVLARFEVVMP